MGNISSCVRTSEKPATTVEEKGVEEKGTMDLDEKANDVVKTSSNNWRLINGVEELWRFTTGYTPDKQCVPGDECVVLRSYHGYYCDYYEKNQWMRNYYNETGNLQKFKINYLGDGVVTLESFDGYWVEAGSSPYVYCGRTKSTVTPVAKHKWYVYITDLGSDYEKDWRVCIKSVESGKFWSARKGFDSWMIQLKDSQGDWEMFWGWKNGKKEDWVQRDEWAWVDELSNNQSDTTDTLKYQQKVGSSFTESTTVTWESGAKITLGGTFGEAFSSAIESSVGYQWSSTSANTWSTEETHEVDIPVAPGKTVTLYQVYGYWGTVISKTPKYKTEEKDNSN